MSSTSPPIISYEYSWVSSGQTPTIVDENIFLGQEVKDVFPSQPIGISLPLAMGTDRSGIFKMSFDSAEAISNNLRNLVMTNHGERLGKFKYGANLKPLCAEYSAVQDFESEAMRRIQNSAREFLPSVQLVDFTSKFIENSDPATLVIQMSIKYDIPALSSIGNELSVSFTVI